MYSYKVAVKAYCGGGVAGDGGVEIAGSGGRERRASNAETRLGSLVARLVEHVSYETRVSP